MQYVVSLFRIFDVFVLVLVSRFQITFCPVPGFFVNIYLLVIRSLQPLIKLIRSSRYRSYYYYIDISYKTPVDK